MNALNHAHQEGLFNPARARKVIVLGAGSVGSWVVEFIARMGVKDIEVWDGDVVNSHNIPMSRYRPQDVGRCKVNALAEILSELGIKLTVHPEMYRGHTQLRNATVISCVDKMEGGGRREIWEAVKRQRVSIDLFCDTRTAEAYIEVLSIQPSSSIDAERYEKMLFSDAEAVAQTCGRHGIVYASVRAAGVVAANLARFWGTGSKTWLYRERCDTVQQVQC